VRPTECQLNVIIRVSNNNAIALLLTFVFAVVPVTAAPAHESGMVPVANAFDIGCSVRHWSSNDGLPHDVVRDFAQAANGYLWIATARGLSSFDGIRFKSYDGQDGNRSLPTTSLNRIILDARGKLWATGLATTAFRFEAESLITFPGVGGIGEFVEETNGNLRLVASPGRGLTAYVFRDGKFESTSDHPEMNVYPNGTLKQDSDGRIWGTISRGQFDGPTRLYELRDGQIKPHAVQGGNGSGMALFHRGSKLFLLASKGLYVREDDGWRLSEVNDPAVPESVDLATCVEDPFGYLWIGTRNAGLWIRKPDGRIARMASPGSTLPAQCGRVFLDRQGSIWVGSFSGLFQFYRSAFTLWPAPEEIRHVWVTTISEGGDGTMWFTGEDATCYYKAGGLVTRAPNSSGNWLGSHVITGRADGNAWVAGYSGPLYEQTMEARRMVASADLQPMGGRVRVWDVVTAANALWVAHEGALQRLEGDRLAPVPHPVEAGTRRILSMADSGDGALLAGFENGESGGLYSYRDGEWRSLGAGLDISRIWVEPEGGIWAGDGDALAYLTPESSWRTLARRDLGLPERWTMTGDPEGGIWFYGLKGTVVRMERHALAARMRGDTAVDLQREVFDRNDGVPAVRSWDYARSIFRSRSGKIWVGTMRGAAAMDPVLWQQARQQAHAPLVLIQELRVDDQPAAPSVGEDSRLTLQRGTERLEISYIGIDLSQPHQVAYRYRLHEYDHGWVDAGSRRVAYYQGLPPGTYRFQVSAANGYGDWNEAGASLAIVVLPAWWQTVWFRLGVGALGFGTLWFSRSIKLRQLRREHIRQEEFARRLIESQEAERKRIAGDLHDSLGQNLLIAKNQLFLVQEMAADAATQCKLHQVADSVGAALEEARSISHQLRPFQLERLGLTKAIGSMLKQTSDSTNIPIESRIESVDGLLPAESELMLYRILQEALSNIVKHADASEVLVTIQLRARQVRMVVQDDGRGFDANKLLNAGEPMQGLGLAGFQERTHLLGGQFRCRSSPGHGTALTFEIPLRETKLGETKT
jgi:signal transduction histidine kinase